MFNRDGCSLSGVFSAVCLALADNSTDFTQVDVFDAVVKIKQARPEAINTKVSLTLLVIRIIMY